MLPEGLRNFLLRTFCCHADNTGIKIKNVFSSIEKQLDTDVFHYWNSMFFTLTVYNDYA